MNGTMAEIGMTSFLGYPLPTREDKVLQVVPWGYVFLTEALMNAELIEMNKIDQMKSHDLIEISDDTFLFC